MNHQPQGDSIWGNINTIIEIALNVYYIFAESGEGIMIPKDEAKNTISDKTATMGKEDNGYLCYGRDDNMDIPMYEVLQKRIATCEKFKAQALKQMQEIKQDGSLRLTDYFGECKPPNKVPFDNLSQVRNGIYFVNSNDVDCFTLHESIASNFLSPTAYEFGKKEGDYLYYDLTTCAAPINELRHIYNEINNLIISEDSLNATLSNNFKAYTALYNEIVHKDTRIPTVDAPTSLFLQRQLDAMQTIHTETEETQEHEEQDDYGFEP